MRGGSWYVNSRDCRSASRDDFALPDRDDTYVGGFRVVCVAAWTS
ncbi:MAG: hypothetical protein ACM65M_09235 [Microcoleus sp.]